MDSRALWDKSASNWAALMDKGEANRTMILDPAMLRLAGDVRGLDVLDVGCGEGRFARMLAERGAKVTGVEPTRALREIARQRHPDGEYVEGVGETLPFPDKSFDLTIAYLVLIDIPDFRKAIQELARVTKRGGRVLVANVNSFMSTRPDPWIREDGALKHVAVDNYFDERADVVAWGGIEIVNFHRPLSAYMSAFLEQGLRLAAFEEPRPAGEGPGLADDLRVPTFVVMCWQKE